MFFPSSLKSAILIKRYNRFLADVQTNNNDIMTIHCANTGAMTGCANKGDIVWYSTSNNPKRKLPNSWELTQTQNEFWICVNTIRANQVVKEALYNKEIQSLTHYDSIQTEVKYGEENSRIDFLLLDAQMKQCYLEIKSVTLFNPTNQFGYFPDAITLRGQKHIRELISMSKKGHRAIIFFLVMHSGIQSFAPAKDIDPTYTDLLKQAIINGVEVVCYNTIISPNGIILNKSIPIFVD